MKRKIYSILFRQICCCFILSVFCFSAAKAQGTEKIVFSVKANDDVSQIYSISPNGTGLVPLFSFYNIIADSIGRAYNLRVSPDGKYIAFDSKHDQFFNPQQNNIFHISSDGSWWDQDTPDDIAGYYSLGTGTVNGTITDFGTPNAWVTIEGYPFTIATNSSGNYSISNVPAGSRYLQAFSFNVGWYNFTPVNVLAGQTVTAPTIGTTYDNYYRGMSSEPAWSPDGNYIYWSALDFSLKKSPRGGGSSTDILAADMDRIQQVDISPTTGKIVYVQESDGIYTANADGSNPTKIFEDAGAYVIGYYKIRWSHDGEKIAYTTYYSGEDYAVIIDKDGTYLDSYGFTGCNLAIGGWSPNNDKIAVSLWTNTPDSMYIYTVLATSPYTATPIVGPYPIEKGVDWGMLNPDATAISNTSFIFETDIEIFPNPSNGMFQICMKENVGEKGEISISDMLGNIVYSENIIVSYKQMVDLSHLSKGVYIFSYKSGSGSVSKKLVIE
jgi:hypothetical protein